jgi:hypothetical protein
MPEQTRTEKAKRTRLTRDQFTAALILDKIDRAGKPIVSREEAAGMTAAEIIELFRKRIRDDHIAPVSVSKNNHVSNRQLITIEDHAEKTARDVPQIAKTRRIEKEHAEFRRRVLAKAGGQDAPPGAGEQRRPKAKIKSRPLPGTKASGWKRKMNGELVRR